MVERKTGRSSRKCECKGTMFVTQTVSGGYGERMSVMRRYRCNKCRKLYKTVERVIEVQPCRRQRAE